MLAFFLRLLDGIFHIIGYSIMGGLITNIFNGIHLLGLLALKLITFSGKSIDELKEKYKDSSKPYFLGVGICIGIIHLLS